MLMVLNCEVPTEVSEEDFDFLSGLGFSICKDRNGHKALRCHSPRKYRGKYVHQFVAERMGLIITERIDHRDGDTFNNRRSNIRAATSSQNCMNSKLYKNNLTEKKGVTRNKRTGKFGARIHYDNISNFLGWYETKEEAYRTYCKEGQILFGEFFNPGFTINEIDDEEDSDLDLLCELIC